MPYEQTLEATSQTEFTRETEIERTTALAEAISEETTYEELAAEAAKLGFRIRYSDSKDYTSVAPEYKVGVYLDTPAVLYEPAEYHNMLMEHGYNWRISSNIGFAPTLEEATAKAITTIKTRAVRP